MFCLDRREHLKKEIIPALRAEITVISDRYAFSTIAFGGLEVSMHRLAKMNETFICPNKVFYLRVRPEECLRRVVERGRDIRIFEELERMHRVAENYENLASNFGKKFVMLDGEQSKEKIHQQVIASLK